MHPISNRSYLKNTISLYSKVRIPNLPDVFYSSLHERHQVSLREWIFLSSVYGRAAHPPLRIKYQYLFDYLLEPPYLWVPLLIPPAVFSHGRSEERRVGKECIFRSWTYGVSLQHYVYRVEI